VPSPEYLIEPRAGYSPAIGHLVSMLAYTRATTLMAVRGLTQAQLDFLLDDDANSIAMLLEHMAAIEEYYQRDTFGVCAAGTEWDHSYVGMELGPEGRQRLRGRPLDYYLDRLQRVRAFTLEQLALRDDAWLAETSDWWDDSVANNHWKWFHVMEDELNHRGQIRLIRKRLPRSA
jgi:uncharacterized damage-inducible protein DinB